MAQTFDSRRLRHQRSMDRRLAAEHRQLAQAIAALVLRASGPEGTIPNRRTPRSALSDTIWAQAVKPYYVGRGDSPLQGDSPASPYAKLLYDGVVGATRIQVERQAALVRRLVKDETVLRWLLAPRSLGGVREIRGSYDPWHLWVDAGGYRLSDRIWRTSIEVRSRVDALLDYHIARGTAAVDIAQELEPFLTPGGRGPRTVRPYGREGSYAARRLARTEITRAAGQGTIQAAQANPFVTGLQWRLSASHPRRDICDDYARGGPNGDGIYAVDQVPTYPAHPQCVTPGQMVRTQRGDMSIEQVGEGDLVLTHMGRYRPVLATWATPHDGAVYEFVTERGRFELTGNHPVLTRRGWVYAECVQLGDQVLYAGVSILANRATAVPERTPAQRGEPDIADLISSGVAAMPSDPIAFDGNFVARQREIDYIACDAKLFLEHDSVSLQALRHQDFGLRTRCGAAGTLCRTELLGSMAFLDLERLAAIPADIGDAVIERLMCVPTGEMGKSRVVKSLGAADLAPDFGTPGGIGIAGQVSLAVDATEHSTGGDTARAVVFFPTGGDGIAHGSHGDIVQSKQGAQHAISDAELPVNLGAREPLPDVDIAQQDGDGASIFGLKARGVVLYRGHIDNLLSLSPGVTVGRGPGSPLVSEVANPTQALTDYTPIRAIRQRHYSGPVYNMEVADDHSYTVNGAAVHNCICSLLPVATGGTADLVAELRADIRAATPRARALQGIMNPGWLVGAIMGGLLDEALEALPI